MKTFYRKCFTLKQMEPKIHIRLRLGPFRKKNNNNNNK